MTHVVLVDGYNVLLELAAREHVDLHPSELAEARARLEGLLGRWAALRGVEAAVAWDGRRAGGAFGVTGGGALRVVHLDGASEADDWIVHEAQRRSGTCGLAVATRDRGLIARLPRGADVMPLEELANDLYALDQEPLTLEHAGIDPIVPASDGPIDTSRLPRRRVRPAEPEPAPPPRVAPTAAPVPRPDPSEAARAEAAARKEQRRKKFERARRRKRG